MKWAAGFVFAPGFLERYARADDLDDIRARDDLVDERLWNTTGHEPVAVNRRAWL